MRSVVFLALGAVLLAGLFFVLRPEGSPPLPSLPSLTSNPAPNPTPAPMPMPAAEPAATPAPAEAASEPRTFSDGEPRTFDLEIRGGRVTSGTSTISVVQGDLVVLRVTSDREDDLHVHGYDLALRLHANQAGSLAFQANQSGRFDVELHRSGEEIAAIEVHPK